MTRRVAVDPGPVDVDLLAAALGPRLAGADAVVTLLVPSAPRALDEQVTWAPGEPLPGIDPEVAVRGRADLAVRRSVELLRDGEVDFVVSASPEPAVLAASRFVLTRHVGVREPVVAVEVTTGTGACTVMDVSGRGNHSAANLTGAAAATVDGIGPQARIGWLAAGTSERETHETVAALAGLLEREVAAVDAGAVLAGDVDVALTTGTIGKVFLDVVRALSPHRIVLRRLAGLTTEVTMADARPTAVADAVAAVVAR